MKKMQIVLVVLGSIALLAGGCSKSVDGSSYNYASGNLSMMLSTGVEKSYDASLKALEQLQLVPTEKAKDALGAKLVAKTSADKKVTITLARVSDTLTNLTIEVGMVGDKTMSNTIYTKIMENLKKP
jgi:hypothetical protein